MYRKPLVSFSMVLAALAASLAISLAFAPAQARQARSEELAGQAMAILQKHCFECHGQDEKKRKGGLNLLDRKQLMDKDAKYVVAGSASESELIKRIEDKKEPMPPKKKNDPVSEEERKILRDWIAKMPAGDKGDKPATASKGQPEEPNKPAEGASVVNAAATAKEVFRTYCLECHGGPSGRKAGGIDILNYELLVKTKKKVKPGKPGESRLVQLLEAKDGSVMPPAGQKRLPTKAIDDIKKWISEEAPPFPKDIAPPQEVVKNREIKRVLGPDYILKNILRDINTLKEEDRPYVRYFSSTHLLVGGATQEAIDQQRDALTKVINHLTWEKNLVYPYCIDKPLNTIFRVDIRRLGWDKQYFKEVEYGNNHKGNGHHYRGLDLFDLVLLDYPYGVIYDDSYTYDALVSKFLYPSGMVLPVPSVRIDWFVSTATLPPLYEDLLRLPPTLHELEKMLGVHAKDNRYNYVAKRAGMAESFVSRNNRVVERHPLTYYGGALWESFDFKTSVGKENIFKDPVHLNQTGGEMIFNLPNGLQAYFVCNAKGDRLEEAPVEIVNDGFASDKVVRNGLSCIRCHDGGMKGFTDAVRPTLRELRSTTLFDKREALGLYPEQKVMDKYLQEDTDRFQNAMGRLFGKRVALPEPLRDVSGRFLDAKLHLSDVRGELGWDWAELAELKGIFKNRPFTEIGIANLVTDGGQVGRDAWENYYDQVVAFLNIGVPVVPLDGLVRKEFDPFPYLFEGRDRVNFKINQEVFKLGDELKVTVTNKTGRTIYIELIGTVVNKGEKYILASDIKIENGKDYAYTKKLKSGVGKDEITLFASDKYFPAGKLYRGYGLVDRVVHHFYGFYRHANHWRVRMYPEPRHNYPSLRMVKLTKVIETKAK